MQLVCELCGGTDFVKQEGTFVCQTCGCKYTIEEARKLMLGDSGSPAAPAAVPDQSGKVENYLNMAKNALEATNNEEAENYANKVIEIDAQNCQAWLIKGEAAGWQSKAINNRIGEAVTAWLNAIKFAKNEEEREEVRQQIADKYVRLWAAMISLRAGNFGKIQSTDNLNSTLNDVNNGIAMMNTLTIRGGVSFNRANIYEVIAKHMNGGAVDGYKDAQKDFGPEHRKMAKWQWNNFTASCDNCVKLLERASELVRSDSLGKTICGNMITIAQDARDSQSWTFNVNSWRADHYDPEYSFTDEAKKNRTNNIESYRKKKSLFEKGIESEVLKAIQGNRASAEIELGRKQYWDTHADEKQALEAEKEQLRTKIGELRVAMNTLPILADVKTANAKKEEISSKISMLKSQKDSLGLFKGKEKKALQDQIDQLLGTLSEAEKEISRLQDKVKAEKAPFEQKIRDMQARISEIEAEFTKERGRVSAKGQFAIPNAVVDGMFTVTPNQLREHLNRILPKPYEANEVKQQACDLHEDLSGTYSIIISDMSVSGDNKNSGVILYLDAADADSPVKSVMVQVLNDRELKQGITFVSIGSLVLMSFAPNLTQDNAEAVMCKILYSESSALFGEDDLTVECASYTQVIFGIINLNFMSALIRAKK